MKALILSEGGKKIGLGHITRSLALMQAFEEQGITAELLINGDASIKDILIGRKHKIFDWLKEKKEILGVFKNYNSVIVDSYLASRNFYNKVSEIVKIPVYIDDYKRIDYPCGIVVNGAIYAKEISYKKKKNLLYLLGSKYTPLRREFWDVPGKKINRNPKNILITFGGIDQSDFIYKLTSHLKNKFDLIFNTIEWKRKVGGKKMLNLMIQTDICISAGGQTTYELARCGVPTIGVCFSDNQLLNLKAWGKNRFLEFAGWHNDKNLFRKIEACIKDLDYKNRIKMSRIGKRFIDGQGSRRTIREILKYGQN